MTINNNKQRGAVSLFVVIFAALLITVVTVSFVRIMISDQQQATTTDLSQSAYDSAQAGVEDAKRVLLRYQSLCNSADVTGCATALTKVNSSNCNDAVRTLTDVTQTGDEVKIQTGGSNTLDQAYTCVKIHLDTIDYIGTLPANESKFIPLKVAAGTTFDTIQIQWFNSDDLSPNVGYKVNLQPLGSTSWPLLSQGTGGWPANRPSIMRTQFMQFSAISTTGFKLSDFDSQNAESQSNANTLFLYPSGTSDIERSNVTATGVPGPEKIDIRIRDLHTIPKTPKAENTSPFAVTCSGNLITGGFACTAKLQLPTPIGGGDRKAFLNLSALYNKTNYRIMLLDSTKLCDQKTGEGDGCVKFNAVQPEIDSTGRANDLFRRVQTRVELTDVNFPYPNAAIDITGNLCKDFTVTDNTADWPIANIITNGGNTVNDCTH